MVANSNITGSTRPGDCLRRGMNTPGAFGHRHSLHPVHTALEFEPAVGALTFDAHDDFLVTTQTGWVGAHHLDAPAARFSVARIHSKQFRGKQRRFATASTGAT